MPTALDPIDPDALLREAVSALAVTAFARGIDITVHIDNRLPERILGDAAAVGEFLRRGLSRTLEAGHTTKVALALWLDNGAMVGGSRGSASGIILEACRTIVAGERRLTGLSDLWTLRLGDGNARPTATRRAAGVEAVLIPLPCTPDWDARPFALRWEGAFHDRYMLNLRDVVFDRERFQASLAAAGLEAGFADSVAQALALARRRADEGKAIDLLVLDCASLGSGAVALARNFRADPRLAGTRIVLTGGKRGLDMPSDEISLFDVVPRISVPWRRLMDVLHEIVRAPAEDRPQQPPPSVADRRRAGRAFCLSGAHTAGDIPPLSGRRILIAEDVGTNQVMLKAVLAPTGAEVEILADGASVVARHAEVPADVILMDLQMPGMGGIAALRRIRELGEVAGSAPVIALTAYARNADRQLAMDAGMDAYLAKPIVVAELYDLLRKLLAAEGNSAR